MNIQVFAMSVKPLVCGHAVVLCEDASSEPGEEQSTDQAPIASQHGCY